MRSLIAPCIAAVIAACGATPSESKTAAAPQPTATDAAPPSRPSPVETPAPVTEAECTQLFDHAAQLWVAERAKNDGWQQEDADSIRAEFHSSNLEQCKAMPRASFECGMRSQTAADLRRC